MPYAEVRAALVGAGIDVASGDHLEAFRGRVTALVSIAGWTQQAEGRALYLWEVAVTTMLSRGIVTSVEDELRAVSVLAAGALQEAGFVLRGDASRVRMDMGNKTALVGLRFIILEYP